LFLLSSQVQPSNLGFYFFGGLYHHSLYSPNRFFFLRVGVFIGMESFYGRLLEFRNGVMYEHCRYCTSYELALLALKIA